MKLSCFRNWLDQDNQTADRGHAAAAERYPGLDTLRAAAIVTVMAFHVYELHAANTVPGWMVPVVRLCWAGVDLFFVLSGYLIGLQLLRPCARGERPRLRVFFLKRLFRVSPAYAVVVGLYLWWPVWREAPRMSPWWEFATFTENYLVRYPAERAFSHAWSLCVEEHFYLILPLLVVAVWRRPLSRRNATRWTVILVGGVMLLGMGIRAAVLFGEMRPMVAAGTSFLGVYVKQVYFPTTSRLDGLLVGVVLALVRCFRPGWWRWMGSRGHGLLAGGVGCVGVALWLMRERFVSVSGTAAWGVVVGFPLLSLGLGMVVASALSENGWLGRWTVPGARMVATLAFALYLSHKGILHLGMVWLPGVSAAGGWRWVGVFATSSLLGAAMLYAGVEWPLMRLRDWILRRWLGERRGSLLEVGDEVRVEPGI